MDWGLHEQHAGILAMGAAGAEGSRASNNSGREPDPAADLENSWVMLTASGDFEPLPHETPFHKSRGRVSLDVSGPSIVQGKPSFSRRVDRGTAYITNKRFIFLPTSRANNNFDFSTLILKCEDSHVGAQWIGLGASYWETTVKTVANGNIPEEYPRVNVRLVFHDGGHSGWALKFEDMKGRLHQFEQVARDSGQSHIFNTVTGEELPRYTSPAVVQGEDHIQPTLAQVEQQAEQLTRERRTNQAVPDEPPPAYDEATAQAVQERFDDRSHENTR